MTRLHHRSARLPDVDDDDEDNFYDFIEVSLVCGFKIFDLYDENTLR